MKFFLPFILAVFSFAVGFGQSGSKVNWDYTAKKLSDKKYEIRMVATIQPGWHLYSQNQGSNAIALPTTIKFANNPLIIFNGKPKEIGKLYDQFDKATNSRSKFYSNKVEFVQTVTLKSNVKTAVTGEVEFMVCDEKQCLPPTTNKFSIKL